MKSDAETGSNVRLRIVIACYVIALASLAAMAGRFAESAREWTMFSIAALIAFIAIWRRLAQLIVVKQPTIKESVVGLPIEMAKLQERILQLDMHLEHAPIALWQCRSNIVEPLNIAARRLLAPGRAHDKAELVSNLAAAKTGRCVISFESENGFERALLACNSIITSDGEAQLLALLPIESELESETLVAWRQLVHVLTHEIMNSLTPISSLSNSAHEMYCETLADKTGGRTDSQTTRELLIALETVSRRSTDLIKFVDRYKSISELPAPVLSTVTLTSLFGRVERLVQRDWQEHGGSVLFGVDPTSLELLCDAGQLEQVLLNLIKNAREATTGVRNPAVEIHAHLVRGGRLAIRVNDNGPGIISGTEGRIFTPFFSTREDGSGIGLAVVRSLLQGMGGTVRYTKLAAGGASFVITF